MTSPPKRRKRRTSPDPAPSTTASTLFGPNDNADKPQFDFDKQVVAQIDWSIWRALWRGEFRLAVRCERCGRWLTDGRSKGRRHGARCAAQVGLR